MKKKKVIPRLLANYTSGTPIDISVAVIITFSLLLSPHTHVIHFYTFGAIALLVRYTSY
jgi:hypothetical protein